MILHGDCLEVLKTLPENSADALVTDPPAGISFMGKDWDSDKGGRDQWIAWLSEVMRECMRVMKPGAHGLVWSLPRTSHWTATALENAGFEVRDKIYHLQGQGFPKSLDISKAIDKAAGAKREVVGTKEYTAPDIRGNSYDQSHVGDRDRLGVAITAPATDAAKQWAGWGTALKPSCEEWILIRKPCSEKTVAANVLKWNCGALNIDGCRIETQDNFNGGTYSKNAKPQGKSQVPGNGIGREFVQPSGRFPANLVLSGDAPEMLDEQSGFSRSPGKTRRGAGGQHGKYSAIGAQGTISCPSDSGGASRFFYCAKVSPGERNAGLDRYESITIFGAWENADQLAQLLVDTEQLPPRVTDACGALNKSVTEWNTFLFGSASTERFQQECRSTTETAISSTIASKTLSWLLRSNTSASIRDANCVVINGGSLVEPATKQSQSTSSISAETDTVTNAKNAQFAGQLLIRSEGALKSSHPTVKPIKLMRYLCKLVTPPGGHILDPFAGSGSTGVTAKMEGFEFVGIEKDAGYFEIASKRIESVAPQLAL